MPALLAFCCLPIGGAFSTYFYKGGLFVFDAYFIAFTIAAYARVMITNTRLPASPVLWVICIVVAYGIVGIFAGPADKYFFRDIRLVLFLLYLYTFLTIGYWLWVPSRNQAISLFFISSISCIVLSAANAGGLIEYSDNYYEANSFRYIAVPTYIAASFVILSRFVERIFARRLVYFTLLSLCFLAISLSGSRVLVFGSAAIFLLTRAARPINLAWASVALTLVGVGLVQGSTSQIYERLFNLEPVRVMHELQNRFLPFIDVLAEFQGPNYITGLGFGTKFEIPWFAYREMKDIRNNYIDSAYLTLYAKLGFMGLAYLGVTVNALTKVAGLTTRAELLSVWAFFVVYLGVYCMPYQIVAVGFVVGFFLFHCVREGYGQNTTRRLPVTT